MTIAGIPAQIAARHDHVRMYFFGFPATPRLLLAKGVPEAKITTHAWVPVPDYPQQVARVDIGLAPVEDNRFNSCKSDIKAVEYGACAIPTVATDSVTYRSFVRHGDNGFLCRTTRDWLQALTTLATNHSQRIAMGVQARKDAEARDIEHGIHLWDEALTDILERKRHVPTALLQR
jgi:glycosyltransferase involved in cell wall biosynthesis